MVGGSQQSVWRKFPLYDIVASPIAAHICKLCQCLYYVSLHTAIHKAILYDREAPVTICQYWPSRFCLHSITTRYSANGQENLVATPARKLDVDPKYLDLLGFTHPIYNGTRYNFTIVTYVWDGHASSAILLSQNIAQQLPNDTMLIYDLGLSADDARQLAGYCNNSRCAVIPYDLTPFPSYVSDEHMHAYRPLIIKDALCRSRAILFLENNMRLRPDARDVYAHLMSGARDSGVLGWATRLQAVSSLTHPKMFKYFETDVESFQFLQMVSLDMAMFVDTPIVNEKILLPWIKCTLTMECIHPIGE